LAAADAHGFEAVARAAATHFAQQRGKDPPARRADLNLVRVPERGDGKGVV
jgi:hypothetical protein